MASFPSPLRTNTSTGAVRLILYCPWPSVDVLVPSASGAFPWGNNTLFFNPKVRPCVVFDDAGTNCCASEQGYGSRGRGGVEYLAELCLVQTPIIAGDNYDGLLIISNCVFSTCDGPVAF